MHPLELKTGKEGVFSTLSAILGVFQWSIKTSYIILYKVNTLGIIANKTFKKIPPPQNICKKFLQCLDSNQWNNLLLLNDKYLGTFNQLPRIFTNSEF